MKGHRLSQLLHLVAALATLALALVFFRAPLMQNLGPWVDGATSAFTDRSAPGFVLRITSTPPGGRLFVDGVDRGTVPLLANVACIKGQGVRLAVTKEGYPPWERQIACREGQTLIVRARLGAEP